MKKRPDTISPETLIIWSVQEKVNDQKLQDAIDTLSEDIREEVRQKVELVFTINDWEYIARLENEIYLLVTREIRGIASNIMRGFNNQD